MMLGILESLVVQNPKSSKKVFVKASQASPPMGIGFETPYDGKDGLGTELTREVRCT